MAYQNFSALTRRVKEAPPKTVVVAAAHDLHTLEAVFAAMDDLPMQAILVGNKDKIRQIATSLGRSVADGSIVDAGDSQDCAKKAVDLIRQGKGDVLMKGILETGTLLKAVLDKEEGIRGSGVMSHLAILEVPAYHKLIAMTDCGMLPYPTLEQKAALVHNAVEFMGRLGYERPKVAALAAVETVSERMPETVEAQKLQEMCREGLLGDCELEGPLSFDLAVSKESAAIKGVSSNVSGDVDLFLVPNIAVGNIMSKSIIYWGGGKMAGCVLGAKAPIVLVSRGASAEEKLLSIMLCICGTL